MEKSLNLLYVFLSILFQYNEYNFVCGDKTNIVMKKCGKNK
jgi:hypothetical protein